MSSCQRILIIATPYYIESQSTTMKTAQRTKLTCMCRLPCILQDICNQALMLTALASDPGVHHLQDCDYYIQDTASSPAELLFRSHHQHSGSFAHQALGPMHEDPDCCPGISCSCLEENLEHSTTLHPFYHHHKQLQ